jgi:hypothetical protein
MADLNDAVTAAAWAKAQELGLDKTGQYPVALDISEVRQMIAAGLGAIAAAAGMLSAPGFEQPAAPVKIPDTSVAGEHMQDFDLLVTVRVYGAGSAMDAAGALGTAPVTFDLPGDGEVEILIARPALWRTPGVISTASP